MIENWERKIGVSVVEWGIRKIMKTRWGTCGNTSARRIWVNLEQAKKPALCLEYILAHDWSTSWNDTTTIDLRITWIASCLSGVRTARNSIELRWRTKNGGTESSQRRDRKSAGSGGTIAIANDISRLNLRFEATCFATCLEVRPCLRQVLCATSLIAIDLSLSRDRLLPIVLRCNYWRRSE